MCPALAEALWLHAAGTCDDLFVAYPSVDRGASRRWRAEGQVRQRVTIMADSEARLDVVDRLLGAGHPGVGICLDLDVSWRPLSRPAGGAHRHPAVPAAHAGAGDGLRPAVDRRAGFRLAGVMGNSGQVAAWVRAARAPSPGSLIRLIQARRCPS